MKKVIILFAFIIGSITTINAQLDFGIKAGLNYNSNGDYINEIKNIKADKSAGYHAGIFLDTGGNLYLRPELVYTKTKSSYENDDFDISKLDLPIMVGIEVFKSVSIFAGPSLQYILDTDTDIDDLKINDLENDFTIGLNVGIALQIKKVRLDVRYERGLSDNEVDLINATDFETEGRIDTRSDQIIFSLSVKLF